MPRRSSRLFALSQPVSLPQELYEEIFKYLTPLKVFSISEELCKNQPHDEIVLPITEAATVHFAQTRRLDLNVPFEGETVDEAHGFVHSGAKVDDESTYSPEKRVRLSASFTARYLAAHDTTRVTEIFANDTPWYQEGITLPIAPLSILFKPVRLIARLDRLSDQNYLSYLENIADFSAVSFHDGLLPEGITVLLTSVETIRAEYFSTYYFWEEFSRLSRSESVDIFSNHSQHSP